MADSNVSSLGAVSTLADADLFYVVDNGVDGKLAASTLKTYVSASPTLVTPNLGVATLGGALAGGGHDLNNLGVVFLTEQAAAEADVAGKGQIWVETATPNVLRFTDDAGTDFYIQVSTSASLRAKTVTASITAAVGSSQGDGPLTSEINQISTCANAGDAVTLPSAAAGLEVTVTNNGAQACDVFPASGDNLGAGANTAVSLAAGANITYMAYNSTNWFAKT